MQAHTGVVLVPHDTTVLPVSENRQGQGYSTPALFYNKGQRGQIQARPRRVPFYPSLLTFF
jgi:hypothetical protein